MAQPAGTEERIHSSETLPVGQDQSSELQQRPDCPEHSEIMNEDLLKWLQNVKPSSDEDFTSESGVSIKIDMSIDRPIHFSLMTEAISRLLPERKQRKHSTGTDRPDF